MSWDKLKHYFKECIAIPSQSGNVVSGDMAGGDITRQTITGDNNTQIGGNGISTSIRNGHVTIKGPVKSVVINGKKLL